MAYLDYNYRLSDQQDFNGVSGSGTYTSSTNAVNLQVVRDLAQGHPLFLHFKIDETFQDGTNLIAYAVIVNGTTDVPASGSINLQGLSQEIVGTSPLLTVATELNANDDIVIPIGGAQKGTGAGNIALNSALYGHELPHGAAFGVVYQTNGTFTAGKISTRLTLQSGGFVPDIYPASTNT